MKRFLYAILISILMIKCAFAATETAESIYAKAYAQMYKGNNKVAITTFLKGISYYPDCAFLYAGMGDVYKKEGDYSGALDYYTQAQQKKYAIDNYKIDFYSTRLQKNQKDINSALNNLFLATKENDSPALFRNINYILNEKYTRTTFVTDMYLNTADEELNKINQLKLSGQHEAAVKGYIALLNSNPKNFQAANNAGATLIDLKDYALAKKYLEQALAVNTNSAIIYNNLGVLNFYQQKYSDMENNFEKSLKINANYLPAINNLQIGKIQSELAYYKTENIESILDIMKRDVENYYAVRTLSQLYFMKGDFINANKLLEPLSSSYNFKLYTQKAITAYKAQNYSNALNYINQAITLYSDNNADYEIRGRIYASLGRYSEASTDFKKVISKNQKNENVYYYQAQMLYKSGDLQSATNTMKNFVAMKKGNANSQYIKLLFD